MPGESRLLGKLGRAPLSSGCLRNTHVQVWGVAVDDPTRHIFIRVPGTLECLKMQVTVNYTLLPRQTAYMLWGAGLCHNVCVCSGLIGQLTISCLMESLGSRVCGEVNSFIILGFLDSCCVRCVELPLPYIQPVPGRTSRLTRKLVLVDCGPYL